MKRLSLCLGGVLLLGVAGASTAAAQCAPTSNNFCLDGVGNGNSLDGIYVSPYHAIINGVPTYVICDDFEDEVQVFESWTASSGTVGSSTVGLFGPENSAGYAKVASLSEQLIWNLPTLTSYQQDLLSYSIWAVFDPTGVQGWLDGHPGGGLTWSEVSAEVASTPTTGNFSNVTVYTPQGGQTCCGRPQEFITVSTPEAPGIANIAADLLGLGALLLVFRRKLA